MRKARSANLLLNALPGFNPCDHAGVKPRESGANSTAGEGRV